MLIPNQNVHIFVPELSDLVANGYSGNIRVSAIPNSVLSAHLCTHP